MLRTDIPTIKPTTATATATATATVTVTIARRLIAAVAFVALSSTSILAADLTHLDITPPNLPPGGRVGVCGEHIIQSQLPRWTTAGASQDELAADPACTTGPLVSEIADDFPADPRPCTSIRFWGLTGGTFFNETTWDIEFYPDAGGRPAEEPYARRTVTATNLPVDGVPGFLNFEHCAEFVEPVDVSAGGWVVVQAQFCRGTGDVGNSQWFHELHPRENGSQVFFRAPLFDYFTFTPGDLVFDEMYDSGWELMTTGAVPIGRTSWGGLKVRFR